MIFSGAVLHLLRYAWPRGNFQLQCEMTAVWAVLTNHQTKINNDQNDLSSMPKMTWAIDRRHKM